MKKLRDMTDSQFREACRRNQLRPGLFWLVDTRPECPGVRAYGVVSDRRGKLLKRESLGRALRTRDLWDRDPKQGRPG